MGSHVARPNTAAPFRNSRCNDGICKNTFFIKPIYKAEGCDIISNGHRNNWGLSFSNLESKRRKPFVHFPGVLPKFFKKGCIGLHNFKSGKGCSYTWRRHASAKNKWTCMAFYIGNYILRAGDKSSEGCKGFTKSAHDKINLLINIPVLPRTPSSLSNHSNGMCIIHKDFCIIFLCKFYNGGKFHNFPCHGEDPISKNYQPLSRKPL